MSAPEIAFYDTLLDALRLRPGLRTNYAEDVRWLFQLRLWDWLEQCGHPVTREYNDGLHLRRDAIRLSPGTPLVYETGVQASPRHALDSEYCQRYFCLNDYSYEAMNYAHGRRKVAQPADYVTTGPLSLGSFGAVMAHRQTGEVPPLPGGLRSSSYADAPFKRTQCILAWLGVWLDGSALPSTLVRKIDDIPSIDHGWPEDKGRWPWSSWASNKVRLHYGKPGDDEAALRKELGFNPLGQPVSEEILYRSVGEVFGADAIMRRYRGRELQGLEIDVWVPALRLGFEYQGEQHSKHVKHWHGEDGLQRQKERDARKKAICEQLGYRIFYFYPQDWLDRVTVVQKLRAANALVPEFVPLTGGSDE